MPKQNESEKSEIQKEIKAIYSRQKEIVNFYSNLPLERQTKIMVFYELMGPLGGLDPIAKTTGLKDIHGTVNFLYGYYFKLFNFPEEEVGYSVTAPIRYEQSFEEEIFFNKNKDKLESLTSLFENDQELTILNNGYSTNYRINEYFGDDARNFYWKINIDNSPFYSYNVIKEEDHNEYQKVAALKEKYNIHLDQMKELKIQTIYKCEDKIIIIIDGLSDNAFGYIYNAESSYDVNCGMLTNRFRIEKDIMINDQWRFWFAK